MRSDAEQLQDEMLVMQWQDGQSRAMGSLVDRWQRRLWQHARRLTGDTDGAWEVVQDAWLGMIRTIGRLDDPRQFRYWAYRIVTNKACDWVRRQQRHRHTSLGDEASVVDRRPDVTAQTDSREEVSHLLSRLSVDHCVVVSLRYIDGFSVREIARILGLPEGTVKSRLHYAKNILRQWLV